MKMSNDGQFIIVLYDRRILNHYQPVKEKKIRKISSRSDEDDLGEVISIEEEEEEEELLPLKHLAIMRADTLELVYNNVIGNDLVEVARIDMIWKSKYLYINDPQEAANQHMFFKVKLGLDEMITDPCFKLMVKNPEDMHPLEAKDLMFNEKNKTIYTLQVSQEQTENDKSANQYKVHLYKYDFFENQNQPAQDPQSEKSFTLKSVPNFSVIQPNKSFKKFFVVDDDDKSTAYILNLHQEKDYIPLENQHHQVQQNAYLYEEFYGLSKDQEGVRQVVDHRTSDQKPFDSGLKTSMSSLFDIQYSAVKQGFIEVTESLKGHLLLCYYQTQVNKISSSIARLREISGFSLNFPYFSCCKGNSELLIRNLHHTKDQIVLPLGPNKTFLTFVEISEDHIFNFDGIKEKPRYGEMSEKEILRYQKIKKLDKVDICYMVLNEKNQYETNIVRLFPYAPQKFFIAEQWICKTKIPSMSLSLKEVCQAQIFTLPFQKAIKRVYSSTILLQTKDSLIINTLTSDTAVPYSTKCNSEIRAVYSERSGQREYFFVQNENHGSQVKILSSRDFGSDPMGTVFEDSNNRIVSMCKRKNYLFILDENFTLKQFEIISNVGKEKSKLELICILECTGKTRDLMQKHKDGLFTRFHRTHVSQDNSIHINGHFFRFFNENTKLMASTAEEDLFQVDSHIADDDTKHYLRGPFNITDCEDNLAYLFEDQRLQGFAIFKNCLDSKLNFLVNVYCSYASFLVQDKLGGEEILVCINGFFFLFKPNGEIIQEVLLQDPSFDNETQLEVQDVSDTLTFFVFKGIEKVYELITKGEKCFKIKSPFFRVPQENLAELEGSGSIKLAFSNRYGRVNPQPLNNRSGRIKQNEQSDSDCNSMKDVVDDEMDNGDSYTQKKKIRSYESKNYMYIEGSMEVGDEGTIWSLYYDVDKQKVRLIVNNQELEERFVPMQVSSDTLIYKRINSDLPEIRMVLVEHYLIMAVYTKQPYIYYLQVDQQELKILSKKPEKITLEITYEWEFIDIKNVNADDRVQIQLYNEKTNITSLITWNLKTNLEDRSLEIPDKLDEISKGVNSTLNYCNLTGVSFDLEYGFPLYFFADTSNLVMKREFFEAAFSEGKDMIVIRDSDSLGVSLSISMLERRFLQNFNKMKEKLRKKSFPISMVNFRTQDGNNLFHFLIQDFKVLKKFQFTYMKFIDQFEDEDDKKKHLELFLLILYPNSREVSPFDIAMTQSSQFVDLFLVMLAEVPDYSLSRFIFKELVKFKQLMGMGLKSFETFLDRCLYQNLTMQKTFVRHWKHGEHTQHIFKSNTALITKDFLDTNVGLEEEQNFVQASETNDEDSFSLVNIRKTKMKNLECKLRKSDSKSMDELEKKYGGEKKRINISMVEFDWVFKGDEGEMFVEELASTENDDIFKVETIRICILFLWKFYFKRILLCVFLPYTIFFIFFFTYSTFVTDGDDTMIDYLLGVSCAGYSIYALFMEIRQIIVQGKEYFFSASAIWNFIDVASSIAVLMSTVIDLIKYEKQDASADSSTFDITKRDIMSLAIFLLWLKFFYFLRIFNETSAFIRMITEIIKDMGVFSLIYLLGNISLANAFFILDGANDQTAVTNKISDGVWNTLVYTYLTGLGEFGPDNFPGHPSEGFLWFYFLICTILLQLVLLNLLIAIMGDTFDRVQEMKEEAKLKELCSLISDNWFWLDQKKTFEKTKYICIATIEQADGANSGGWEGKLAVLKTFFQNSLTNLEGSLKQMKQVQKDDIMSIQKTLGNQIEFMHQKFNKSTDSIEKQQRKLYDLVNQMRKNNQSGDIVMENTVEMEEMDGDENMPESQESSMELKKPSRQNRKTRVIIENILEENEDVEDFE